MPTALTCDNRVDVRRDVAEMWIERGVMWVGWWNACIMDAGSGSWVLWLGDGRSGCFALALIGDNRYFGLPSIHPH